MWTRGEIMKIRNLPYFERPREKLIKRGAEALSLAELLAVILGTGTKNKSVIELSYEILTHFGSLNAIAEASIPELVSIHGLGTAKAVQLKAAVAFGVKVSQEDISPKYTISSPSEAYRYIRTEMENLQQEHLAVIVLNAKGGVLKHEVVTKGTRTTCLIDTQSIFHVAIKHNAVSLLAVHNHPSGDPTPSEDDIEATKSLQKAAHLFGIRFLDHIIIGRNSYISIVDHQALF